jgi:hypothetical protein
MAKAIRVTVENVVSPGHTRQIDAVKYEAMKAAMLRIVPKEPPGVSALEMREGLQPLLPQDLWPNGAKAGWWQKSVQLDLEAKGILCRDKKSTPLRWWRAG